uniref:Putative secreted protein n=1 Tax=Rhipicephalus microplus TaxID=6941 RepID=A0A6G5A3B3_RHIMP
MALPEFILKLFFFLSRDTSCTDHFCGSKIAARVSDSDINANLPTALARDVRVLQALLMNCAAVKRALLFSLLHLLLLNR